MGTYACEACVASHQHATLQVLSVVAQQLAAIQAALAARAAEVTIAQHTVPLAPSCGVFVTMNPGYADRAELPDNLQALFRPVTLSVPDSNIVAEAMLFWCGPCNHLFDDPEHACVPHARPKLAIYTSIAYVASPIEICTLTGGCRTAGVSYVHMMRITGTL